MSNHQHPYGKPENVLRFAENNKTLIHDEPLKQIFLHPDVRDRKIVAFSIIGAYRKGKSFFLDYCLRFLYAHYPSINYPNNPLLNPDNWIGDENEPLIGFSWRSGSGRDTTGIVMWNDVFLHTIEKTGEKIAIVIIDTQGLFDNQTSTTDNSKIFALGTLISSIQVLNLSSIIQENQLQYFQFAVENAKLALKEYQDKVKTEKCFQKLLLLIRDWDHSDDFQFGIEGGNKYFEHFLNLGSKNKNELNLICESIIDSFENIECSLLSHPGKNMSKGKEYDGRWSGMDREFKDGMSKLIDHLLNSEELAIKKINGTEIIGKGFVEFFPILLKIFQTDERFEATTLSDLRTAKEMNVLINSCIENYKESVKNYRSSSKSKEEIQKNHEQHKKEALNIFDCSKKMGSSKDSEKFREDLEQKIQQLFDEFMIQRENERKRIEDEKNKLSCKMEEEHKLEIEKMKKENKMISESLKAMQHTREELEKINKKSELNYWTFNERQTRSCYVNEVKNKSPITKLYEAGTSKSLMTSDDRYDELITGSKNAARNKTYNHLIKFITFSKSNGSVNNLESLASVFLNETVRDCKITVITIVGMDSDEKTKTFNNCLEFLYKKYLSLNHQTRDVSDVIGWVNFDNAQSSSQSIGTTGLEVWNDVFLHTAKNTNDKTAIVLMSTFGLFDRDADEADFKKNILLGTLISSVQMLNFPDILESKISRTAYCESDLKKYTSKDKKINKEYFNATKALWNSLDWKKGIIHNIFMIFYFLLLPNINQIMFTVFNKKPEKKIFPFLQPDNFIKKKLNDIAITGSEFFEYIKLYCNEFQKTYYPSPEEIEKMTLLMQFDIYIEKCINFYNDYMSKDQYKEKESVTRQHKNAKTEAETLLINMSKDLKDCNDELNQSKLKLQQKLDSIFEINQEKADDEDPKIWF